MYMHRPLMYVAVQWLWVTTRKDYKMKTRETKSQMTSHAIRLMYKLYISTHSVIDSIHHMFLSEIDILDQRLLGNALTLFYLYFLPITLMTCTCGELYNTCRWITYIVVTSDCTTYVCMYMCSSNVLMYVWCTFTVA